MEKFYIRKIEEKDLQQVIDLRVLLQIHDGLSLGFVVDRNELISNTRKYLKKSLNKSLFLFGGFLGDKVISICGCIVLELFPTQTNQSGKIGYITSVFTLEEHRGKGFQKQVFKNCLQFMKESGISNFELSTINPVAINLYRSEGFYFDTTTMKMK